MTVKSPVLAGLQPPLSAPFFETTAVRLYHGDFRDILPQISTGEVDALITDPPYGNTQISWDRTIDWRFFWNQSLRICKMPSPFVLFACGKFTNRLINSNPKHYRYELIWEKSNAVGFLDANHRPLRNHENILIFAREFRRSTYNPQFIKGKLHTRAKGICGGKHYSNPTRVMPGVVTDKYHPRSVLQFENRTGNRSLHPTQKPLELMRWLVRSYPNPGDLILEPFAGSGTTLLAAALEGRRAIGIEQDLDYCAIIQERLQEAEQ